jgi:hypothetical protein
MAAFHGLYVGVDLTADANAQFNAGQTWALHPGDRPNPQDGHCMLKVKADGKQLDTWVTWGVLQPSTRDWTAACIQEAWAIVSTEDQAAQLDLPTLVGDIVASAKTLGTPTAAGDQQNQAAPAFALGWQLVPRQATLAL